MQALEFYGQPIPVETKADLSPLTQADQASHALITTQLSRLTPDIPVVSEESAESAADQPCGGRVALAGRSAGRHEGVHQTDRAVHGQYRPGASRLSRCWASSTFRCPTCATCGVNSDDQTGAWLQSASGPRQPIHTRRADLQHLTVVASRDHAGPVVEAFLERLEGADVTSMGSSLKFCLVAEGKADFYPRVVPTMQWDTAAAQAIVEAAGGHLTQLDGTRLAYHKDQLRNPSTMAFGDRSIDWVRLLYGSDSYSTRLINDE